MTGGQVLGEQEVPDAGEENLKTFLKDKLKLDSDFIEEDVGPAECGTKTKKHGCKFCKAKGHASDACKKQKAKSNSNQKSGNTHKARQILDTASPNLTDDESNDHKVGRTIISCDEYKIYRMTGREEKDQEPTNEVFFFNPADPRGIT